MLRLVSVNVSGRYEGILYLHLQEFRGPRDTTRMSKGMWKEETRVCFIIYVWTDVNQEYQDTKCLARLESGRIWI
jgi:hypothetical protein